MAKNFIRGFYPEFKLAECCNDDQFRPVLNFLCVRGEYIYATDARIAVRARLTDVCNLADNEIALLDGKLIPSKTFKELQKASAIEVTADGIVVKDDFKTVTYAVFSEGEASDYGFKFPNVEAIISGNESKVLRVERIGISTARLSRLAKAIGADNTHCALGFTGDNNAVIVRGSDKDVDVIGILMPVLID